MEGARGDEGVSTRGGGEGGDPVGDPVGELLPLPRTLAALKRLQLDSDALFADDTQGLGAEEVERRRGRRRLWVRHALGRARARFVRAHDARWLCGTWNCAGRAYGGTSEELLAWLAPDAGAPPDVVCLALQEMVPLSARNVMLHRGSDAVDAWVACVMAALAGVAGTGSGGNPYVLVSRGQLVGVGLIVVAREDVATHLRGPPRMVTRGVGLLGVAANKGVVCASFTLWDTRVAVVAAHLSSGDDAAEKRNAEYADVCERVVFPADEDVEADAGVAEARAALRGDGPGHPVGRLESHDIVFWMGDLNYRFGHEAAPADDARVRRLVEAEDWGALLALDQLRRVQATGRAFSAFSEMTPCFVPSYKWVPGGGRFEIGDHARSPAWTDRVLWRCRPPGWSTDRGGGGGGDDDDDDNDTSNDPDEEPSVQPLAYSVCEGAEGDRGLRMSDHRPVNAAFSVRLREVDKEGARATYAGVMRQLDAAENLARPRVAVSPLEVLVSRGGEPLAYGSVMRSTLTLRDESMAGTGAVFSLVLAGADADDGWLRVSPRYGLIPPQGGSSEVTVDVGVDHPTIAYRALASAAGPSIDDQAAWLRDGRIVQLDAFVVVHAVGGGDVFVQVRTSYRPGFRGLPLALLAARRGPHGADATLALRGRPGMQREEDWDCGLAVFPELMRVLAALAAATRGDGAATPEASWFLPRPEDIQGGQDVAEGLEGDLGDVPEGSSPRALVALLLDTLADLPDRLVPNEATARMARALSLARHDEASGGSYGDNVIGSHAHALAASNDLARGLDAEAAAVAAEVCGPLFRCVVLHSLRVALRGGAALDPARAYAAEAVALAMQASSRTALRGPIPDAQRTAPAVRLVAALLRPKRR